MFLCPCSQDKTFYDPVRLFHPLLDFKHLPRDRYQRYDAHFYFQGTVMGLHGWLSHMSSQDTFLSPDFLLPPSPCAPAPGPGVTQSPVEPLLVLKTATSAFVE